MAVFDFTMKITRFRDAERVPLTLCAIAETFDRLGVDHLLADLNREGGARLADFYPTSPIVINGSAPEPGVLESRLRAEISIVAPSAEIVIEWQDHDPERGVIAAVNREIERVSRLFGGLARGAVPARVRLAILNTDSYLVQFGRHHETTDAGRGADLTLNALYSALSDVGGVVGIDWKSSRADAEKAFGSLRLLPTAKRTTRSIDGTDYASFVDRWVAHDEAELAAADFANPMYPELGDARYEALFEAVREALLAVPAGGAAGSGRR